MTPASMCAVRAGSGYESLDYWTKRHYKGSSQHHHSTVIRGGLQVERYDFEGLCLLLGATVRRAQFDAKRGDRAAKRWLKGFLDGVKC